MLKVAIVYHFIPNYRKGVFDCLGKLEDIELVLIAGHSRPGQEHVPEAEGLAPIEVKNHWLGKILWQRGLGKTLRQVDADVVIFLGSWTFASTWFYGLQQRLVGRHVLFWTHGWKRREGGARGWIRSQFYRIPHALLLYGKHAKALGLEAGLDDKKLRVIGNSLASPAPSPTAQVVPTTGHILWVARLIPGKRLDLLLDALALAVQEGHELHLSVVGDGSANSSKPTDEIAERVTFLGAIHDEERLAALFRSAQVVAIPASAGLTILHALGYGCPVIVDDDANQNGPEHDFVEPGFNGSTFVSGSAEELAEELIRWTIDSPATAKQRTQIAESAIQFASPQESALRILEAIHQTRPEGRKRD